MTESEIRALLEEVEARIKRVLKGEAEDDGIELAAALDEFDATAVDDMSKLVSLLRERLEGERWIPVSERLPEKDGKYLCWHDDEIPVISYFTGETFWNDGEAQEIIFWKPIAAPEVKA